MPIISVRMTMKERTELQRKSLSEGYRNLSEYLRAQVGLKRTRDTGMPNAAADGYTNSEEVLMMMNHLVDQGMQHSRALNRIAAVLGAPKDVDPDWLAEPVKSVEHLVGDEPQPGYPSAELGLKLPEGFSVGAP